MGYKKWYRANRENLEKTFGGCCYFCKSEVDLQFAHVHPTKVNGKGRGSFIRLKDVKKHPLAYLLLCEECHKNMDKVMEREEWVHSFIS